MPPTIQHILGKSLMSGEELRQKQERLKRLREHRKNINQLKQLYPKGNRIARKEYLKTIEKKPDFRKELNLMKRMLIGGK